jgi:hypothetical protein
MKILGYIFSLIFATHAYAQEVSEEKFAAIVQYAEGKQGFDFKDLIGFNKTIEIPKDSYLKVITQKRCIAVFYENTKVQSPVDKVSAWKVLSGSARWICPEARVEKIIYKEAEVQIQNGEFLLTNGQLTPFKNSVRFENNDLIVGTVYINKNNTWVPMSDQPDPYDLWKKHKKFPVPTESAQRNMEKPDDPYVTRLILNVAPIGVMGFYHHEQESQLSDTNMQGHFFRLGVNFPWRNKSVLTFLEYDETDGDNNKNNGMGPPPVGEKSIRLDGPMLGIGLRHSHVSSSSFYYYLGFSRLTMKFDSHPAPTSFYNGEILYPYNVAAGGGYQKIFWAKNWISLMLGVDLKITQSLTQGKVENFNTPPGNTADLRSAMTSYSGFVYLGPVFNF